MLADARADLVVYLAGADPHEGDRLGRLCADVRRPRASRRDGARSRAAKSDCRSSITIAGGYGTRIEETVDVHVATARIAARYADANTLCALH